MPRRARFPGFLWRKLGRVGRVAVALVALALLAAVIVSIPGVRDARRGNAERERRERAEAAQRKAQHERELVRPRPVSGARTTTALERAIDADVVAREHRRPLRVGSTRGNRAVEIGFPYRALIDPATGAGNICRALGRPGEGSLGRLKVTNPEACGG